MLHYACFWDFLTNLTFKRAATWGLFTTKMFIRVLEGPRLEVSEMVGKVIGKTIFSGKAHNLRRAKDSSRYFALWGRHFDSKTKKLVGLCFHSREESSAFMERILQGVPCRCVSNFDFRKEKEEDLALSVGMLLHVLKKFESGWWFGVDPNHQLGLFPSNYVTEVLDQRAQPSNKDKDENSTCCICMEGAKDALVLPCGHLCMRNSTNHLLTFLLDGLRPDYPSWKDYFHVMIVGAQKPSFFEKGTTLRKVDLETGALKVGSVKDRFEVGQVYNGGSMTLFNSLAGIQNPGQVLYVGDHIFSDIIVSKKTQGWRNLLVVRELDHEVDVWQESQEKHHRLQTLEFIRAEIFRGLDSEATTPPDLTSLRKHTRKAMRDLDEAFNPFFGSLFRSGSKQSFFSMQVQRYADLYTADYLNLLHYPLFYSFYAGPMYLAHEREIPYEALGGGSPAPLPSSK
ncbi:Cytosolic purine 5'-nucleotidase [Balamuthia mandrillaris]